MAKWLRLLLISGLCRKPGMQEIKSLSRQLNSAYSKSEHGTCLIVRLMSRVTRARSSTIAYLLHEMDGSSDLFKYRCKFTILVLPDVNRVCGNLMDQWLWFLFALEIVVCSLLHSIWCNSCVTQIVSPERYRARIHFGVIEYAAYINMSFIIHEPRSVLGLSSTESCPTNATP